MGVSDRHYFAWLTQALERFERESGELRATGARPGPVELWVLAGPQMNPPIEFLRDGLGRERTTVRLLDKFARLPGVTAVDFNALDAIPADACDALFMSRASYMVEDPGAFLVHTRRILRPGGLMIVDWLHGSSDAPALTLPGHHEYAGGAYSFCTTYCDPESLDEFGAEFGALIRHVNRPPWWTNPERPGAPLPIGERLRRLLGGGPRREITRETYLGTLRAELGREGKHLVEPEALAPHFKVLFRDARYLYPITGKFYLHLLTVLRPVGK